MDLPTGALSSTHVYTLTPEPEIDMVGPVMHLMAQGMPWNRVYIMFEVSAKPFANWDFALSGPLCAWLKQ